MHANLEVKLHQITVLNEFYDVHSIIMIMAMCLKLKACENTACGSIYKITLSSKATYIVHYTWRCGTRTFWNKLKKTTKNKKQNKKTSDPLTIPPSIRPIPWHCMILVDSPLHTLGCITWCGALCDNLMFTSLKNVSLWFCTVLIWRIVEGY